MSISSSYTGACALAAKARVKFQGQDGNKKYQNLPLIIAHAQLYDRLDDYIEGLRKIRRFNASGEKPPAPLVAVPNHKDPFRMNQQVNHQRDRTSNPRNPPRNPQDLAAECADEGDEDPKPPSKTSDPTCSVSIQELEELRESWPRRPYFQASHFAFPR